MHRIVLFAAALLAAAASSSAGETPSPETETRPASSLGTQAMTFVGRVQPHGLPTEYWFEYGTTGEFGMKSDPQPLPPRLAAYYRESWDDGLATWLGGMSGKDLVHHQTGGAAEGYVRYSEPSGHDPNHVDGIGTLHLSSYFYPSTHPNPSGQFSYLGGGIPDMRGARVTMSLRGNQWKSNGSELVWWTQSDNDIANQSTADWRRANWAYTGYSLNDALQSGKWEQISYRLQNNPHHWTYGGNNLAQRRPNYAYATIDFSQGNVSCDFFHLLAFVDPAQPPTGSIDFDEFELAYRNYSLLLPSNGGKLVESPAGSPDDAALLTDGWRHGKKREWRSGPNPVEPLEFVYELQKPVTVEAVQIHQHSRWPARAVEVQVSADGEKWTTLLEGDLPQKSPAGPNFAFLLKRNLKQSARHVKVRVLSGYQAEHWGLGEIEIFGQGAALGTDDGWYFVNRDVSGLTPGATYHYRLVARNSAGTVSGEPQTYTVPKETKPLLSVGKPSRLTAGSAKLEGRLNPQGKRTQFHFEYGLDSAYGAKSEPEYGGLQITPRTIFANLSGLMAGTTYHYRIVATNDSGTTVTDDATFQTLTE